MVRRHDLVPELGDEHNDGKSLDNDDNDDERSQKANKFFLPTPLTSPRDPDHPASCQVNSHVLLNLARSFSSAHSNKW